MPWSSMDSMMFSAQSIGLGWSMRQTYKVGTDKPINGQWPNFRLPSGRITMPLDRRGNKARGACSRLPATLSVERGRRVALCLMFE